MLMEPAGKALSLEVTNSQKRSSRFNLFGLHKHHSESATASLIQQLHQNHCVSNLTSDSATSVKEHVKSTLLIQTPKVYSSTQINEYRKRQSRIRLNVGGIVHEVLWRNLERLPHSRLGRLRTATLHDEIIELCDDYSLENNEFYFDRNPIVFPCIVNMYRLGKLHLFEEICVINFLEELEYWGLSEHWMEGCCQQRYYQRKEQVQDEMRKVNEACEQQEEEEEIFGNNSKLAKLQRQVWNVMEKPQTSKMARAVAALSIFFIVTSTVATTIGSISFQQDNDTLLNSNHNPWNFTKFDKSEYIETVCISWFTAEFLLRLLSAPNKCKFMQGSLNIIDLIAILPFYIDKVVSYLSDYQQIHNFSRAAQILRILRVLRIFKLARHSVGLQSLGYTLRQSYKELGMLMMFVAIGVLLFASLAYFAERDSNPEFSSVPASFWWAIITMTTVGYGDMAPRTNMGKIVGSGCCICGVLVVAMPIPIIVNNFAEFYRDQMRREKAIKHKKELEKARASGSMVSIDKSIRERQKYNFNEENEPRSSAIYSETNSNQAEVKFTNGREALNLLDANSRTMKKQSPRSKRRRFFRKEAVNSDNEEVLSQKVILTNPFIEVELIPHAAEDKDEQIAN